MNSHSRAEIKRAAKDIIFGRLKTQYGENNDLDHLSLNIAEVFARMEDIKRNPSEPPRDFDLSSEDKDTLLEVYWDLVLDRVIAPGSNWNNRDVYRYRICSGASDHEAI